MHGDFYWFSPGPRNNPGILAGEDKLRREGLIFSFVSARHWLAPPTQTHHLPKHSADCRRPANNHGEVTLLLISSGLKKSCPLQPRIDAAAIENQYL